MDHKPSLGQSRPPYKLIPTLSMDKYTPNDDDVQRVLGTGELIEQRDRSWLNVPGQGGSNATPNA